MVVWERCLPTLQQCHHKFTTKWPLYAIVPVASPLSDTVWFKFHGNMSGGMNLYYFHWNDSPANGDYRLWSPHHAKTLHFSAPPVRACQAPPKNNIKQLPATRLHAISLAPRSFAYICHGTSSRSAALAALNWVVSPMAASNGNGSSAKSATPLHLET